MDGQTLEQIGLPATTKAPEAVTRLRVVLERPVIVPNMVGAPTAGQGVARETIHPAHGRLVAAALTTLVAGVRGNTNHTEATTRDTVGAVAEMANEGLVRPARMAVAALGLDAPNAAAAVRDAARRRMGQA